MQRREYLNEIVTERKEFEWLPNKTIVEEIQAEKAGETLENPLKWIRDKVNALWTLTLSCTFQYCAVEQANNCTEYFECQLSALLHFKGNQLWKRSTAPKVCIASNATNCSRLAQSMKKTKQASSSLWNMKAMWNTFSLTQLHGSLPLLPLLRLSNALHTIWQNHSND